MLSVSRWPLRAGYMTLFLLYVSPVVNTELAVFHLDHQQSAAFPVATREAVLAIGVSVLLHNQQHGRRLRGHQLAQATSGQTFSLNFLLNVETAKTHSQIQRRRLFKYQWLKVWHQKQYFHCIPYKYFSILGNTVHLFISLLSGED